MRSGTNTGTTTGMLRRLRPLVLGVALVLACRGEPRSMKVELTISGMVCDSCVQAITHELGRIEGVQSVNVDLEAGRATVVYSEDRVDVAKLEQTIEQLGYTAEPGTPAPSEAEN